MRVYDVTVPISESMPVQPGESRIRIDRLSSIAHGDQYNGSQLSLGSHTGTHVDAPYHFVPNGLTVDRLSLDLLMGTAFVAEVDEPVGGRIEVYDLARLHFPRDTARLLIKTSNSDLWENGDIEFERNYIHLAPETAPWLVKRGIRLIGVDYLSVDSHDARDFRVHQTLLGAGIVILEGLNLSRVPAGPCQLLCLPLKVRDGDGAPARVLLLRD